MQKVSADEQHGHIMYVNAKMS